MKIAGSIPDFTGGLERALFVRKPSPLHYAAAVRIKDVVQFSPNLRYLIQSSWTSGNAHPFAHCSDALDCIRFPRRWTGGILTACAYMMVSSINWNYQLHL